MTTNLPVLRADRRPALRPRCAIDVLPPPVVARQKPVAQRRTLSRAEWFVVAVIVFMTAGGLASSLGYL